MKQRAAWFGAVLVWVLFALPVHAEEKPPAAAAEATGEAAHESTVPQRVRAGAAGWAGASVLMATAAVPNVLLALAHGVPMSVAYAMALPLAAALVPVCFYGSVPAYVAVWAMATGPAGALAAVVSAVTLRWALRRRAPLVPMVLLGTLAQAPWVLLGPVLTAVTGLGTYALAWMWWDQETKRLQDQGWSGPSANHWVQRRVVPPLLMASCMAGPLLAAACWVSGAPLVMALVTGTGWVLGKDERDAAPPSVWDLFWVRARPNAEEEERDSVEYEPWAGVP